MFGGVLSAKLPAEWEQHASARALGAGEEFSMSNSSSRRRGDPAAFPLPIGGLFADLELGGGCINLPDDFFAASGAIQVEVISDWQRALEELRHRALVRLYRDLADALPDCSDAGKMERFRVTCQRLEIECPEDMTPLLARF